MIRVSAGGIQHTLLPFVCKKTIPINEPNLAIIACLSHHFSHKPSVMMSSSQAGDLLVVGVGIDCLLPKL